jgi:hypothetical protein
VGVAGSVQTSDATAYLIAEPLVELVEACGYSIGASRGPLGGCGRID